MKTLIIFITQRLMNSQKVFSEIYLTKDGQIHWKKTYRFCFKEVFIKYRGLSEHHAQITNLNTNLGIRSWSTRLLNTTIFP